MAVMPWPGSFAGSKPGGGPPGNNNGPPKPPNAPNPSKGGGGPPPPNLAPAWQSFSVPPSMSIGEWISSARGLIRLACLLAC